MKKLFIGLMLFASILTLASCNEKEAKIVLTDEDGNTKEVVLSATDDVETVKYALEYACQADYSDMKGLKMNQTASGSLDLDFLGSTIAFSGSSVSIINVEQGFDLSASYDLDMSSVGSSTTKFNLEASSIFKLNNKDMEGYVFSEYSVSSNGLTLTADKEKTPFNFDDMISNPDDEMTFDLDEILELIEQFYDSFENSKIVISEANGDFYTIGIRLALDDIMNCLVGNLNEEITNDPKFQKIVECVSGKELEIFFKFETSTGYFVGYEFHLEDPTLLNLLVYFTTLFVGTIAVEDENFEIPELISNLKIDFSASIKYGSFDVRSLSKSDIAKYNL